MRWRRWWWWQLAHLVQCFDKQLKCIRGCIGRGGGRDLEGDEGLLRVGKSVTGRIEANGDGELGLSAVFRSDEVW